MSIATIHFVHQAECYCHAMTSQYVAWLTIAVVVKWHNIVTNSDETDFLLTTDWVHIAEVRFNGAGPTCPDDTVITTPTAAYYPRINNR